MIERKELMTKAAAWMQGRGWGARVFEHIPIEIGVSVSWEANIAN